ncbi:MBL fold metallo-hydrolase [Pseudoalteromonas sp. S4741]|uniref:MBL fold metallo-hydrolase n=1 Tax=Pseudoalteromonas sp. S4741 TaxID=579563 RepID=UPI00201DCF96|nr:MBL fold metallo-hydrolase [Pseudoalteromonas sp. S4741]
MYNADSNSFHVNATLVYGRTVAILIDTGFTKADALRIAAKVIDSGKQLKTIFISQADPDYYFGAEVLQQFFPEAEVITTPAVLQKIAAKLQKIAAKLQSKLACWTQK